MSKLPNLVILIVRYNQKPRVTIAVTATKIWTIWWTVLPQN